MRFSTVLGSYYFAYFAYIGAYSPYITLYFRQLGMTAAQIGLLYSIPQVMRIVGPAAWGHLADSTGKPHIILRAAALMGLLAFGGMYFGSGFGLLFGVLVVMHFFTSAQMPLVEAITLDHVRERPGDYGRIRVWGSVGFIASVLGLGYALDVLPVTWVLHVGVALLMLVVCTAFLIPAPRRHVHEGEAAPLLDRLKSRQVQIFLAAGWLNAFAHAALYTFFSIYLSQLGYSKSVIGWMWTVGVLIEIGVFQAMPQLTQRFRLETLFFVTFVALALRFSLIAWTAQWWWCLVFAQLLHAFTFAIYHASAVGLARQYFGERNAARGQAIYISVTFGMGGFAGAMVSGLLWDSIGPSYTYAISALAGLIGVLILLPGQRSSVPHR